MCVGAPTRGRCVIFHVRLRNVGPVCYTVEKLSVPQDLITLRTLSSLRTRDQPKKIYVYVSTYVV